MKPDFRFLAAFALLVVSAAAPATAQDAVAPELELRRIMRELNAGMQTVVDGISREDWALVAATAPKIANHREPEPAEKMKILAFIGAEIGEFKGRDEESHQAALAMEKAAQKRDGLAVVSSFGEVQKACLACHQTYRERFLAHFYSKH